MRHVIQNRQSRKTLLQAQGKLLVRRWLLSYKTITVKVMLQLLFQEIKGKVPNVEEGRSSGLVVAEAVVLGGTHADYEPEVKPNLAVDRKGKGRATDGMIQTGACYGIVVITYEVLVYFHSTCMSDIAPRATHQKTMHEVFAALFARNLSGPKIPSGLVDTSMYYVMTEDHGMQSVIEQAGDADDGSHARSVAKYTLIGNKRLTLPGVC